MLKSVICSVPSFFFYCYKLNPFGALDYLLHKTNKLRPPSAPYSAAQGGAMTRFDQQLQYFHLWMHIWMQQIQEDRNVAHSGCFPHGLLEPVFKLLGEQLEVRPACLESEY